MNSHQREDDCAELGAEAIVALWERGRCVERLERWSLLAGWGADAEEGSAPLSLREGSTRIARLRREAFGDRLDAVATCPSCGAEAEFSLSCAAIEGAVALAPSCLRWSHGPYAAALRELTVTDVRRVAAEHRPQQDAAGDERRAFDALLGAAVERLERQGVPATLDEMPDAARRDLAACVDDAHEAADLRIDLRCPGCAETRTLRLDLGEHVWTEVAALAERLLWEVDLLAGSYTWTEREILSLGPARRAAYVARCDGGRR